MKTTIGKMWCEITAFVMVNIVATTTIYAASSCSNEGAEYTDCTKQCKNCTSGGALTGACTCSKSDQLVYCDCNTGRNCAETGVVASGHKCSADSSCPTVAGPCPATFPADLSTCPVVPSGTKQKETSTCSLQIEMYPRG